MHFWLAMQEFAKKIRNLNMQWWMWLLSISKTWVLCQADDDPGTLYPVVASTSCSINTVKLVAVCKKLKFCMTLRYCMLLLKSIFPLGSSLGFRV